MVSLTMNLHAYKGELKETIIVRMSLLESLAHPLDWAWLTYALSHNGREANPFFRESLNRLENWAFSEFAGSQDRDLAPLGMCAYLVENEEPRRSLSSIILTRLDALTKREIGKISPLNDPQQLFCVTLGAKPYIPEAQRDWLKTRATRYSSTGRLIRRVFYTACLLELDDNPHPWPALTNEGVDPEDLIALLWLHERYNRSEVVLWQAFENVKEAISLGISSSEGINLVPLSNRAIAILYEAVSYQTRTPDPWMLFETYPLHPRIQNISESLFEKGEYLNAVLEAVKALDEFIRIRTGSNNTGRSLVQEVMGGTSPKIRFNTLKTKSERDEQEGLKLITEGIFAAFRNPKGHEPKDSPSVSIEPYDALDQLVTISYIMKRVEEATSGACTRGL